MPNDTPPKILIVEDETEMLGALDEKFKKEGFSTIQAETGEIGLVMALGQKPDVILPDILLPNLNGMDVLAKIRASGEWGKKVPIIMLTNLPADDKIMQQVVKDEPSYYLVKTDWKLGEVVEKVRNSLGLKNK